MSLLTVTWVSLLYKHFTATSCTIITSLYIHSLVSRSVRLKSIFLDLKRGRVYSWSSCGLKHWIKLMCMFCKWRFKNRFGCMMHGVNWPLLDSMLDFKCWNASFIETLYESSFIWMTSPLYKINNKLSTNCRKRHLLLINWRICRYLYIWASVQYTTWSLHF